LLGILLENANLTPPSDTPPSILYAIIGSPASKLLSVANTVGVSPGKNSVDQSTYISSIPFSNIIVLA